jgi:hypothetical protein
VCMPAMGVPSVARAAGAHRRPVPAFGPQP